MLTIPISVVTQIFIHGEGERPLEACGYLAGKDNRVWRHFPMTNVDQSQTHFSLDPKEQFDVLKKVRSDNMQLIAVYHTHPESPAWPSEEDIRLAHDPEILYVIASFYLGRTIKAFSIKDALVLEKEIVIK